MASRWCGLPRGRPIPPSVALRLLGRVAHLPVFLFGGTLLGAYRDGRIIDDDWDVDVAMLAEDWREWMLDGMTVALERRWGRETPWAMGGYVDEQWRGVPSIVKFEAEGYHLDLHILAPGIDPTWRYWQRGPGDETLMRTPAAMLTGTAAVMLDGRLFRVPERADDLLTFCYGDWLTPVPAAEWYESLEFHLVWEKRAVMKQTIPPPTGAGRSHPSPLPTQAS